MSKKKIGVLGVPGAWSTEALADALAVHTDERIIVDGAQLTADLSTMKVWAGDTDLTELDGLVIKKLDTSYGPHMFDRLETLRLVEAAGVQVFSGVSRIMRLIDRYSCTVLLAAGGIPMPRTVVTEDVDEALAAVRRFESAIVKPLYSTKARGMRILGGESDEDLRSALLDFLGEGHRTFYLQQRVPMPGRDLGVSFVGDEYVGTYARVKGPGAWSTSTREGGHYERHEPSAEVMEVARKAKALTGLDFTCVDVAETPDGPTVFEVSAFGGFRGLKEACGLDAAALYAQHIADCLGK